MKPEADYKLPDMKKPFCFLLLVLLLACVTPDTAGCPQKQNAFLSTDNRAADLFLPREVVYRSDNLIIEKISEHTYVHISFLNTQDFGKVSCNGMIVINGKEAVIFDTPADIIASKELIQYLTSTTGTKINAVIPTHFHADCVGGLEEFMTAGIPVYANNKTINILKTRGSRYSSPINGFDNELVLQCGNMKVYARYFGKGHTSDNIVGYFPADNIIFGGCLIKEMGAGKGNLEDADIHAWSSTVGRVKDAYPHPSIVVPGHGKWGDEKLLDYTMQLFNPKSGNK